MKIDKELILEAVVKEHQRSLDIHGDFHSLHEGYAVLLEESDELWDQLKKKHMDLDWVIEEAIQISAMGMKIAVFATKLKAAKS